MADDKDSSSPASVPSTSKRSNSRVKRPIDQLKNLLSPPDYLFGNTNLPPLNNRIPQNHNAETEQQKTEDQEDDMLLPLKKRLSMKFAIRSQVNNLEVDDVIRPQVVNLEVKEPKVEVIRPKVVNLEAGLDDPEVLLASSDPNRRITRSLIRDSTDTDNDRRGGVRLTRSQIQTRIPNAEAVRIPKEQVMNDNVGAGSSLIKMKPVNQGGRRVCVECESDQGKTTSPVWRNGPEGHGTLCNACGLRYARVQNKWKKNFD